ncbi:MAG: hypothetical protein KJZ83_00415 [Burkholderiaceae bacterium]|nr:hypothetical protein [Burkholderiaceae bacterium]
MSKRKNLNDVIHGDRAQVRGNQKNTKTFGSSKPDYDYGSSSYKSTGSSYVRCYEKHPPLKLPGTDLVIYGGSCSSPVVLDADVYIGFDSGMRFSERSWPWKKGTEVFFKITDMRAPDKPEEFKKLIAWTRKQLESGMKVHCGCIGGHGRTGTFLAALVSEFGEKDAISYVRQHYCQKAVESSEQVKFLMAHFGISSSKPTKESYTSVTGGLSSSSSKRTKVFYPLPNEGSIWG